MLPASARMIRWNVTFAVASLTASIAPLAASSLKLQRMLGSEKVKDRNCPSPFAVEDINLLSSDTKLASSAASGLTFAASGLTPTVDGLFKVNRVSEESGDVSESESSDELTAYTDDVMQKLLELFVRTLISDLSKTYNRLTSDYTNLRERRDWIKKFREANLKLSPSDEQIFENLDNELAKVFTGEKTWKIENRRDESELNMLKTLMDELEQINVLKSSTSSSNDESQKSSYSPFLSRALRAYKLLTNTASDQDNCNVKDITVHLRGRTVTLPKEVMIKSLYLRWVEYLKSSTDTECISSTITILREVKLHGKGKFEDNLDKWEKAISTVENIFKGFNDSMDMEKDHPVLADYRRQWYSGKLPIEPLKKYDYIQETDIRPRVTNTRKEHFLTEAEKDPRSPTGMMVWLPPWARVDTKNSEIDDPVRARCRRLNIPESELQQSWLELGVASVQSFLSIFKMPGIGECELAA